MTETITPSTEKVVGQIQRKIFIQGTILAKTGLHIGGNSVSMAIGSTDNVVVRNPLTNIPYIPGSSLRGKMRSLMERARGEFFWDENKKVALPGRNPESATGQLFGVAADEVDHHTPTRLIVRDAPLTDESRRRLEKAPNLDMPFTEVKTEVVIDRITSAATPRQFERVPAGAEFEFNFILTLLNEDEIKIFLDLVYEGLRLLEDDTLGGSGSRGYGQVKFYISNLEEREVRDYQEGKPRKPLGTLFPIPEDFKP